MDLKAKILNIKDKKEFQTLALEIFHHQYKNNIVYRQWCDLVCKGPVVDVRDIPFLPISFFKTHNVSTLDANLAEDYFLSSGTSNMTRSKHNVFSKQFYIDNTISCFEQFYDKTSSYCYICLLPNYLEQQHSSLICMMDNFVKASRYKHSGFFKDNLIDVADILAENEHFGIESVLFGVTYALLDLIELKKMQLKNTIVFETGGMKGRRQETSKKELHKILKTGFGIESIASEYGMCELFSQAYAIKDGIFHTPKQMQVVIKPINDPMGENLVNHNGIINIIDLANVDTCSFIQTEDIGLQHEDGSFEIIGRIDHSALRGCNLMYNS